MSKYGFDEKEIRKKITTMIDKDGFHRETVTVYDPSFEPVVFWNGFSRRSISPEDGSVATMIGHEIGMSRKLKEDEDYFVCDAKDVYAKYGMKFLTHVPDVSPIVPEFGIKISETSINPQYSGDSTLFIQLFGSKAIYDLCAFAYKKESGEIVGTSLLPNRVKLRKMNRVEGVSLSDFSTMWANIPLLMNERIVIVPKSDDSETEETAELFVGDYLPLDSIEVFLGPDEDEDHTPDGSIYYFKLGENSGLTKGQSVWVVIADSSNKIVDFIERTVSQ